VWACTGTGIGVAFVSYYEVAFDTVL